MPRDFMKPLKSVSKNGSSKKAPFGYYGAKQRLARQIVENLPPHNAWIEGFCGSAALTFAKKPAPIEVINDLDGEVVNVFRQLRNNPEELCRLIALTPYASEEFEDCRSIEKGHTSLERARRFLVRTMMTVNGTIASNHGFSFSQSYSRQNREARVNRWYNLPERLEEVVERLRNVRIENRDAIELMEMFSDRPATLVYLDPPYFTKRKQGYVIDANDKSFHENLLNICMRTKCMVLLSGYDNDLYRKQLTRKNGWYKNLIRTNTRDTSGKDYSRTEILWTNSHFKNALANNRVPIRLSKNEKKDNKLNPPRKA